MQLASTSAASAPSPLPHALGTCKWYSTEANQGFLWENEDPTGSTIQLGVGTEIYAPKSAFQFDVSTGIEPGALVAFDIAQGPKGPQATNVQLVTAEQADAIRSAWHGARDVQPAR